MNINMAVVSDALSLMGMGMLSIFVVLGAIFGLIWIMIITTSGSKK